MQSETISIWEIAKACKKIKYEHARQIFQELVKWMFFQFKSDHHVVFGKMGNFGFKIQQKSKQRIPILFFNQSYLKETNLTLISHSFILKPLLKINSNVIANHCTAHVTKDEVDMFFEYLTTVIDKNLRNRSIISLMIDLDILGRIIRKGNQIDFHYFIPKGDKNIQSNAQLSSKTTLRAFVEKQGIKTQIGFNKMNLINSKEGKQRFLPKIQKNSNQDASSDRPPSLRKKSSSKERKLASREKSAKSIKFEKQEMRPSSREKKSSEKPFRTISLKSLSKNMIKQSLIGSQMMGAGNDPLKKQHDYAKLISDPKQLMRTTFLYKKSQPNSNIPIIDSFSRTLACPIATQRQNPLVAARIGSNLSINTQNFEITSEGIKNIRIKTDILEKRVPKPENELKFISQELQYQILIKEIKTQDQQKLLQLRRKYFKGYMRLFDHIEDRHITEIKKQTLSNILSFIDRKYENPPLVEQMLEELFEEYKMAIKKSIIDYILMDVSECERLSLYIKYKQVPLYGTIHSQYPIIDPESLYRAHYKKMDDRIMKNSSYFLMIQRIWYDRYQSLSLIEVPQENSKYLHIDDFLEIQKVKIRQAKDLIINEWMPILSNIYRDQIIALNRNQIKCVTFFETAATLLYLQIRELIEKGMDAMKCYLKIYDLELLNPPDTVVYLQKTINQYQRCFLNIRISHRKDEIYFMDHMADIKQKIVSIIDSLRAFSEMMPRPQNLITKTEKLFLTEMPSTDYYYLETRAAIEKIAERNLDNVEKALEIFNEYRYLLVENRVIDSWILDSKHDRREYAITFSKYFQIYDEVMEKIPSFIRMNMVNIDSSELKSYLLKCVRDIIKKMQKSVYELVMNKNNEIKVELEKMITTATSRAQTCEELVFIENQIDNYKRNGIRKLSEKNTDLIKWISITLYNTLYTTSKDDLETLYNTSNFLHNIHEKLDAQEVIIFNQRKKFEVQVNEDSRYFNVKLKQLMAKVDKLKEFGSKMLRDSALQLLQENRKQTTFCIKFIENLNNREKLLGVEETSSTKIYGIDKILKPFEQLWNLVKEYHTLNQSWTRDSIFKLSPDDIDAQVKKMLKLAVQLSNNNLIQKIAPLTIKVAQQLIEEIKGFQKNIPIISVFSNPGLKERHFKQISSLIKYEGQPLSHRSNLYLNKLISMGVSEHISELENISEIATKEYMIETTIAKIKRQWQDVKFQMKQYKDSKVMILTGASMEEIQVLLDDHSLKMITMKGSLYAKTFEVDLVGLDEWINYTNEMIEFAVKVQSTWMYLQPVMTSPDILKHLSVEGTKFKIVDEVWRQITNIFNTKELVIEITKNKKIVEKLKQCHNNLEIVMKGLNSYLESKRLSFPRFFFLSNDELLQILSETKNPMKVQPHLKKCFEGISSLKFQEEKLILGMYSDQDQYVQFGIKIDTMLARGNVDQWLLQVENRMLRAVKNQIAKSHSSYQKLSRKQSLFATCAMSVLTVQMTNWTQMVEKKIVNNELEESVLNTKKDLKQIVELIKDYQKLRKVDIMTLQALIVLSVHNLDIVSNLQHKNIDQLSDFSWQSQLRYYYREFQELNNQEKTEVKVLNATVDFNHQYLGNTSRLVITPLTDRCYRTLCSAIFLNYGGAPEGPAGTGKTETVKDLAKALACQCVVFNCSDGLDYKAMGKFFKGLAASGAWSCFDEFNRINLEVLSVVAQQILSIQTAKAKNEKVLFFQDAEIRLKKNANCFITMNPGYAGRSELPDNLKALFRPVAMMIPDYAMIAEISLYSYGFSNARNLARKIVSTYKLCSQQLSSQEHYDYGMRAVKSVLVAAGNLKRKYPDLDESSLVLKAINDVNVAKFLNFDIPLFNGITSDLFKDVQVPTINYELLTEKIVQIFEECNLTQSDYALEKIIQIYDMILVRHGLMVVGYPFSGKTTALEVLAEAIRRCKEEMNENQIQFCKINPKAITMKQLYGYFDEVSHEWFDGVLAVKFRNFASSITPTRKWLLLDGPVDAIWIQNMNTVLDDNKKLCLNSGQIIAMNKKMSLIFEPMDLLVASPATVSRCGMIYMESNSLGYNVIVDSWLRKHNWLNLDFIVGFKDYFKTLPALFKQIKTTMKMVCYTEMFFLTHSLLQILTVKLLPIQQLMKNPYGKAEISKQGNSFRLISALFTFACVWSFGACVDTKSRRLFDHTYKKIVLSDIVMNKKKKTGLPQKGLLFDYLCEINTDPQNFDLEWVKWNDQLPLPSEIKKERNTNLHTIKVKTVDSLRYGHLINLCIQHSIPILLCGPTGTGKTTLIKQYQELIDKNSMSLLEIIFSSRTSCKQVTQQIQASVDKKGSKNLIGPKKSKMLIYVDDINMPIKELFGAQPPIQFLRQLLDQKGFYDFHEKQRIFKRLIDVAYIYCMSALNNDITPRFLRHSNLLSVANFDDETLNKIFSTILSISFQGHTEHKNIHNILKNSIEIYNQCVQNLKPTPNKSHYIFNLRDLSKLVIGICRADKIKVHSENIGRLWAHECRRVFVDRLLPEDKPQVQKIIDELGKKWGKNMNLVYFSDILSPSHEKSYEEINDLQKVNLSVATALNNYNNTEFDKPMNLVLFNYALEHILIILRIISEPKGNALLVGLGGSGRKSFSALATSIADYNQFSLQITKNYGFNQFREDMKKMFLQIGVKNQQICFIFTDSMIKDEQFLEDINNILNIGKIPNLFNAEERLEICEAVRKEAIEQTNKEMNLDELFQFFLNRVGNQLKLILCFSPIGDDFRTRMRMFPSLVNCTTIDWYTEWPSSGLLSVAKQFLQKVELKDKKNYIQMFQYLHSNSKQWSEILYEQLHRKYYVTPTSFIEFITTFKQLLSKKKKQVRDLIYKYQNGYLKIVQTEAEVEKMKHSLEEMKPQIKQAADDTTVKMELVKIQKEQADEIMIQISGEEKIVLDAVNEANQIKEDCERELAVALPQLKAAQNALLVLDKNSLTQLKSMNNPPIAVRLTMQALCLLIDPTPKQKMKNDKTLKMQTDWWAASTRLVNNPKLLNDLVNFNKDSLTENIINNLGKFLNQPNNKEILTVANVAKSSVACECIIQWVIGIYNFYFVNKKVKPKKQSLREAEEKVSGLNIKLEAKRNQLQKANDKVEELNYELEWAQKKKQKLEKQYAECQIALERAQIIMKSLGSQKLRWLKLSEDYKLEEDKVQVVSFMCSAQIIYFGPFTQAFRTRILKQWLPKFKQHQLEIDQNFSLAHSLGNAVQIRSWNLNGLPLDNFSAENALIIYNSRRWPLLIDPQGQANKWLKKQEVQRKLKVTKPFEDNFIRNLQNCIQFGTPALIENLSENINAALTPILLKQTYKKGATTYLKMGENVLIYSQDFFLYMTTKLSNPHYLPEVCTGVVLINFMITEQGLSDQLLALIVSKERPDLQHQKQKLTVESAKNQKILKEIQDKILTILGNSQNILADETAITVLSASKDKSNEIVQKQVVAEQTEVQIDKARLQYKQIAQQASLLFFVVSSLENLDSMYRYSLTYFTDLYKIAIDKAERHDIINQRLENIRIYFRLSLFRNIGRSLFQKHRMIFSALIALRLEKTSNKVIDYLCSSNTAIVVDTILEKPKQAWLTETLWKNMIRISDIPEFENLLMLINEDKNKKIIKQIVSSSNPYAEKIPSLYENIDFVFKLVLFKCLRPDKMVQGYTKYIEKTIGVDFAKALPFDLTKIYPDSNSSTPILFILSPGSDPFISISNFSKSQNIHLDSISLGQGQGAFAEKLISQSIERGGWIILQNCHLATSWMPSLQKIVEELEDPEKQIHKNFRLWLTSYPSVDFPQSVLQKSLKVTNEPAKGLKNNLMVSYLSDPINNESYFNGCLLDEPFKKLIFSLTFFHAVIQQRRKFGPLGWNISYEFTDSDLRISCKQLKIYLDNANVNSIPFEALTYLISQCNYGGRVTDTNDRRLLNTLLSEIFNSDSVQQSDRNYGNSAEYILPDMKKYEEYVDFIDELPLFTSPELVGLHPNADITKDINQSNQILSSLLTCISSTGAGVQGKQQEQQILNIIDSILENPQFPEAFKTEEILRKYPILYEESMNTVLSQEVGRYNRLIAEINKSLESLKKAIKGEEVMTPILQKMFRSMSEGRVPEIWLNKSYPSLKPLGSYINDLINRTKFFQKWASKGIPKKFWLSGFFFTQSFLTGILQNYSRKNKIPVDELAFEFIFEKHKIEENLDGTNIFGLFIEGARWNEVEEVLEESKPGELFVQCPEICLKPEKIEMIKEQMRYEAPLYKTVIRKGILSTTGHSTNFVMMIKMPTKVTQQHWIKRGVALLTQTNE